MMVIELLINYQWCKTAIMLWLFLLSRRQFTDTCKLQYSKELNKALLHFGTVNISQPWKHT